MNREQGRSSTFGRLEEGNGEKEEEQVALPEAMPEAADHLRRGQAHHAATKALVHVPPQEQAGVDVPVPWRDGHTDARLHLHHDTAPSLHEIS